MRAAGEVRYEEPPGNDLDLLHLAWALFVDAHPLVEEAPESLQAERDRWLDEAARWRTAWFERLAAVGRPRAAVIEIVERIGPGQDPDAYPGVVVPDEVRLNGVPLLITQEGPVVERIDMTPGQLGQVVVTLRVFARRVLIDAERADAA